MIETNNIVKVANELDKRIQKHPIIKIWKRDIPKGTKFTDDYWGNFVDPVNIVYKNKEIQMMLSSVTNKNQSCVVTGWSFRKWKEGISDLELTEVLQLTVNTVEFLRNNSIFTEKEAFATANILINK